MQQQNKEMILIPLKPPYNPEIQPSGFGYKTAWLAVRTTDTAGLASDLGLREPRWLPWPIAMDKTRDGNSIAITSPIDGWILIVGVKLFDWHEDHSAVVAISRRFGEAQFFFSERISGAYHWSRWIDGCQIRSVSSVNDEITENGERSGIEEAIFLPSYCDDDEWFFIGEEDVIKVAEEWSINPLLLERMEQKESHLLVGILCCGQVADHFTCGVNSNHPGHWRRLRNLVLKWFRK